MWRTDPLEKTLMLGKIEGRRRSRREDERVEWHHWLNGHKFEQAPCCWRGKPGILQSMGSQRVRHDWATELTDLSFYPFFLQLWKMGVMSYLISYSSTQPFSGIHQALNHYMMNDLQRSLDHRATSAWLLCWYDRLLAFCPAWYFYNWSNRSLVSAMLPLCPKLFWNHYFRHI